MILLYISNVMISAKILYITHSVLYFVEKNVLY